MSNSVKAVLGLVLVLVILIGGRIALTVTQRPSDEQLIRDALQRAIEASKKGEPGGVLDLLSRDLTVNNSEARGNLRSIADFVQKQKPNVKVENPQPKIIGEEGRIVSPVELELGLFGSRTIKNVTMIFKREDATDYLVIPTTKWRLVEVRVPEQSISDLLQ